MAGQFTGYSFRMGTHINNDAAQAIGEELAALRKANKRLTAEMVLERAKVQESALHGHFEWSDAKAAKQHRLHQARNIIRSLQASYRQADKTVRTHRVYYNVKLRKSGGAYETAYLPTDVIMKRPGMREQVLTKALNEAKAWMNRYKDLEELTEVFLTLEMVIGAEKDAA